MVFIRTLFIHKNESTFIHTGGEKAFWDFSLTIGGIVCRWLRVYFVRNKKGGKKKRKNATVKGSDVELPNPDGIGTRVYVYLD